MRHWLFENTLNNWGFWMGVAVYQLTKIAISAARITPKEEK